MRSPDNVALRIYKPYSIPGNRNYYQNEKLCVFLDNVHVDLSMSWISRI